MTDISFEDYENDWMSESEISGHPEVGEDEEDPDEGEEKSISGLDNPFAEKTEQPVIVDLSKEWGKPEIEMAGVEDVEDVVDIERKSFPAPRQRKTFTAALKRSDWSLLVAKDGGEVVGHTLLCQDNLAAVAVDPDHRGNGIGKELVKEVVELAKSRFDSVNLKVRRENEKAISLYRDLGFETTEKIQEFYDNGDDALKMVKRFDDVQKSADDMTVSEFVGITTGHYRTRADGEIYEVVDEENLPDAVKQGGHIVEVNSVHEAPDDKVVHCHDEIGLYYVRKNIPRSELEEMVEKDIGVDVFQITAPDDGDYDSEVLGIGVDMPNHDVYVDWNLGAFGDDGLDNAHVSIYGSLDDLAQVTEGDIEALESVEAVGKSFAKAGYSYPDVPTEETPEEVEEAIRRFRAGVSDEVKSNQPLLYWLLGGSTPDFKMAKQDADYQDEPEGNQRCANCEYAYHSNDTGNFICSQVRGEIQPSHWCRLWEEADEGVFVDQIDITKFAQNLRDRFDAGEEELDAIENHLYAAYQEQVWPWDLTKAPTMWSSDDDVPDFVQNWVEDVIDQLDPMWDQGFEDVPHAAQIQVHNTIKDSLTQPQGWSTSSIANRLQDEFEWMTQDEAEKIARQEVAAILNKAREVAYKARKDFDQMVFDWVGPDDAHTTEICTEIKEEIESQGGAMTMDNLKELLREKAQKYMERGGTPARVDQLIPHFQCRHTVVKRELDEVR